MLVFTILAVWRVQVAQSLDLSEDADSTLFFPLVHSVGSYNSWAMAGANPQRTSWVPQEVRGSLDPLWYRPIEPYILPRVQIVTAYDMLYVSTSAGLYALDAESGATRWVYPTAMPLGHSPTVVEGVVYVGGFDHRLHAVDAFSGQPVWTFLAGAGFDTNPLLVNGLVYAGNRDGVFYAVNAGGSQAGQLAWKFQAGGPIHFSAAYQDGVVYFAADDGYAYALDASSGSLIWRSDKLPGAGFHSWWPVIFGDLVVFTGSNNYRSGLDPGPGTLMNIDAAYVYPNRAVDPRGTLVGPLGTADGAWAAGTPTIDASQPEMTENGATRPITDYLEEKPWRRTYFVLDRLSGTEYTTDFDQDGQPEYAPLLWFGTHGPGNRYPPVVGGDGVLYQTNNYMSDQYIAGGQISGWQPGGSYISVVSSDWGAVDEPHAYSAGGDLIYWNLCCDRQAGAFDVTVPNIVFADRYLAGILPPTGVRDPNREWFYFDYNLIDLIPGYNEMTYTWVPYYAVYGGIYGGRNGSYGFHGEVNPSIPYQGKVYMHRSNAIIAFAPQNDVPTKLDLAPVVTAGEVLTVSITTDTLYTTLAQQVEYILQAGHLRPGYQSAGTFDISARHKCGDDLMDYWHHPGDTLETLLRALPYLPDDLKTQTRAYLQSEFQVYPPYVYNHIGWRDGASREAFDLPPEASAALVNYPPETAIYDFDGWGFAPQSFYALWKYAAEFGGAAEIYTASRTKLGSPPSDSYLRDLPQVHNAYLAGYLGFLELEKLAGYPETTSVRSEYQRLLDLRVNTFTKDTADLYFEDRSYYYCRALNSARNFMYLTPELGAYLRTHALAKVTSAVAEYERITPYWFVSQIETGFGEGVFAPYYTVPALFQVKAYILGASQSELVHYLDVPAVPVGDLFYIQNLVAAIEAGN